jgi:hypothetical protein
MLKNLVFFEEVLKPGFFCKKKTVFFKKDGFFWEAWKIVKKYLLWAKPLKNRLNGLIKAY